MGRFEGVGGEEAERGLSMCHTLLRSTPLFTPKSFLASAATLSKTISPTLLSISSGSTDSSCSMRLADSSGCNTVICLGGGRWVVGGGWWLLGGGWWAAGGGWHLNS